MRRLALMILLFAAPSGLTAAPRASGFLRLHPLNGHYFEFKNQPTILVTSGEHYGAVLNLDFDYIPYLNELQSKGLNNTRTWTGTYVEIPGAFGIEKNTLAPVSGKFLCPWARSGTPGYAGGGNKFDLDQWDAAYFSRLKDFVGQASARGITVEMNLFCIFYGDDLWGYSPMNAANNVNGVGAISKDQALTLGNGNLLARQEDFVRKIVAELASYDNVYYEVCNEPYFGVALDWQYHIADVIVDAESGFADKHLISLNAQNGTAGVPNPPSTISILNWHYADPPDVVANYYGLNIVIGENETGFDGSSDYEYRKEGWHFILAGGALYNNLDYSFTTALENGTDTQNAPGGGGPTLRSQLRILKDFMSGFNFLAMGPNNGVLKGGVPGGATARALVQVGEQYAIYMSGGSQANLVVELPAGDYQADWVNTKNGAVDKTESFAHGGGDRTIASPSYSEDIALRVVRTGGAPSPVGGGGSILREYWTGIGGTSVADLVGSPAYPRSPSGSSLEGSFEAPTDWAEDYGTRMRGYLTAPVTGAYTFWIASDDHGELWLSTSANPAGKTLIASVPDWTASREWTKYPSQQSAPILLTAGQRYYVEALQKEGGGGDNLAVAWTLPDGTDERPIPGSRLAAVDPLDSDGDGVSDADEIAAGTDPEDSSSGGSPAAGGPGGGSGPHVQKEGHVCGLVGVETLAALLLAAGARRARGWACRRRPPGPGARPC